jgi:hypothetical protein
MNSFFAAIAVPRPPDALAKFAAAARATGHHHSNATVFSKKPLNLFTLAAAPPAFCQALPDVLSHYGGE